MANDSLPLPICDESQPAAPLRAGFSGSRDIPTRDKWFIAGILLQDAAIREMQPQIVTGACEGVDALIARLANAVGLYVYSVIPPNTFFVDDEFERYADAWETIPDGPDGYKRRNQRIVDLSSRLIAFPAFPEDHPRSLRSGTWQTIRMARRKGIPVDVHVLSAVSERRC